MNRGTVLFAVTAAAVGIGVAACAPAGQASAPVKPVSSEEIQVPAPLKVPAGNKVAFAFEGAGVQIYQCTSNAWTLLEPAATLSDNGKSVALHFKGPIWVSTQDGSEVGAAQVPGATVKHSDAVPELLLKANENHGNGVFSKVTFVQRLQTKGGLAPAGSCTSGAQQAVQYSALYRFWVPA